MGKGGGQKAYVSKNAPGYENTAQDYLYNRLGVRRVANDSGTGGVTGGTTAPSSGYVPGGRYASQDEYNRFGGGSTLGGSGQTQKGQMWDSSGVGSPINFNSGNMPQTVPFANPFNGQITNVKNPQYNPNSYFGQDYSDINQALSGFKNINPLTQTYSSAYKPADLNFANEKLQSLPDLYRTLAYDQGSKVARNEAAGNLDTIKEATGVRRPGLLMQAEEGNQRDLMSTLGDLNSRLQQEGMQDKEGLAVQDKNFLMQQQMAQEQQAQKKAAEDYLGYGSRSDLEKNNAQLNMTALQNLYNAGAGKIGLQQGQLGNERGYNDQALQYLLNLFGTSIGSQNQAAANSTAQRGQTLGFLGDAAKIGMSFL